MSDMGIDVLYAKLAAPFDTTFELKKGGVALDYISGEQCISRLNDVLGFDGWAFVILEYGQDGSDRWVRARMTTRIGEREIVREQFGSVQTNAGMSPGDALKGAATDALKKCATLIGVGLYLSHKEETQLQSVRPQSSAPLTEVKQSRPVTSVRASAPSLAEQMNLICSDCGDPIREVKFRDGTIWTPMQLATRGQDKFGVPVCMTHYRERNDAMKQGAPVAAPAPPPPSDDDSIPF